MTKTRQEPPQSPAATVTGATTDAQSPRAAEERRVVLLQPEYEGNAEVLLRTLIAIARRIASERQTVVESSKAGELAA